MTVMICCRCVPEAAKLASVHAWTLANAAMKVKQGETVKRV